MTAYPLATLAAYQFRPLENLLELKAQVRMKCEQLGLKGTVLLASEGINCFVAGTEEQVIQWSNFMKEDLGFHSLNLKINYCSEPPFKRMLVKIKKEIITMGVKEIRPREKTGPYLNPVELKKWLDSGKEVILLDTRNQYETDVGKFKNALELKIDSFRQFPSATQTLPKEFKKKTVVTYCTGGIRCEKASAYLIEQGFEDVYQLDGGILNYFEKCKDAHYDGTCFVFDWRLAVDSELKPVVRSENPDENFGRHQVHEKCETSGTPA